MREKRCFFDGKIERNATLSLCGEEFHHLTNVLRARPEEEVCLFNGDGNFYYGKIRAITKKCAEIFIDRICASESEPTIKLTLFQALAKGDKLSLVMQKITELGASKLVLFESKFCDVKASVNKQERMDSVSISASKQCGRATIVESEGVLNLAEVAQKISDYDAFFVAYENERGETLASALLNANAPLKNIAVMVGAEGGFAEDEIELMRAGGAKIVSLGKRILRTETAGIAMTAIAMSILEAGEVK